jgi:hypothetical protein
MRLTRIGQLGRGQDQAPHQNRTVGKGASGHQALHNRNTERAPARSNISPLLPSATTSQLERLNNRRGCETKRGRARYLYCEVLEIAACPLPNCPILVRFLILPLAPFPTVLFW